MSKQLALGLGLLMALALGGSTGCVGTQGPTFGLWMDVKGPIQGGSGRGSKRGEACSQHWAGVVALGDASIEAAAKKGGIKRVDSVDYYAMNRIVFGKFCTVVRGS